MFRRWKDARDKDAACAPRRADDRAVHAAERLVRRAWALELALQRDREEFALHIERENCDTAVELFIAAQRDGDPLRICVARTVALEALDAVRAAVVARDQARRILRKELRVLTRKPKRLSVAADACCHLRSRPTTPIMSSQGRRGLHLRRLVRWRTAGIGQQ